MKFGIFYELQLPKPWGPDDERQLVHDALEQVELADRLGFDYAWAVEHHFLEEYSHCSAPEVFLAAAAARTKRIRLGHGIRQVIPNYNHPARTAEAVAMLDLVSNGRVDFGIGEGATRLELGGFDIPAKEKRAMSLEAAEQIANMMVMDALSRLRGPLFSMPCRNVMPKPVQKPHPPMWMACTNRDTIKVAARQGLGALAFSFVDEAEARTWAESTTTSSRATPACRSATASTPTSPWSRRSRCTRTATEAVRRGQEGFEFFRYAINALVANDAVPGRSRLFEEFQKERSGGALGADAARHRGRGRLPAIARHRHARRHPRAHALFQAAGVDQVIFLQQAGRNRHEHICESLELFAARGAARVRGQGRRARAPQGRGAGALHRDGAGAQEADAAARRRRYSHGARVRREADRQSVERFLSPEHLSWAHWQAFGSSILPRCSRGPGRQ